MKLLKKDLYKDLSEEDIIKSTIMLGFKPLHIENPPNFVYPEHSHEETKLLIILSGTIRILIGNRVFNCKAKDLIVVPGGELHSATTGINGCIFLWAEKYLNNDELESLLEKPLN